MKQKVVIYPNICLLHSKRLVYCLKTKTSHLKNGSPGDKRTNSCSDGLISMAPFSSAQWFGASRGRSLSKIKLFISLICGYG